MKLIVYYIRSRENCGYLFDKDATEMDHYFKKKGLDTNINS